VDLQREVKAFISKHGLLSRGDHVLVAVSGGPDSVTLLHVLTDLRAELGIELEVAHLQHGIRGKEARKDARFVAEMTERLGLSFHLREVNVRQIRSAAGKGNLEQLAREERYRFFAEVARDRKVSKVAVGHTLDDQAETVLMRFLRGSGMTGLSGMSPLRPLEAANREVLLVRPLLEISKADILEFLEKKRIDYRIDRTNQDTSLLRNWIRCRLLPQLKQKIDPQLPARLAQQAELIRAEDAFLERLARHELDEIHDHKSVDRKLFLKYPGAMQRRIFRLWIEETRGHLRGVDFTHIDKLLKLVESETPQSRFAIPGGWEFLREYETLRLEKRSGSPKQFCYTYEFSIGTELKIPEAGMTIRSESVKAPLLSLPHDLTEAVFDTAALPATLTMRNFRHGDRFRPLGMLGHKKVKDLFIEKKIPLRVRATLPLLSSGQEILWIPGYARSETGRVHGQTNSILRLKALPLTC
jgi:tRNA(Ile)-lysidine synthase